MGLVLNIALVLTTMNMMTRMAWAVESVDLTTASTVEEICKSTENPKLCVSSVGNKVKGKPTAEKVLEKEIEVTLWEIDKAEVESEKLASNKEKRDPKRLQALQACAQHFQKAEKAVKEAATWLAKKKMSKLDSLLSSALNQLVDCDDAFENNNLEPVLEETNHRLERLISNCQTLVRAIT